MRPAFRIAALFALLFVASETAQAQGLIWRIPAEDGTQVVYGGTFTQTTYDPPTQTEVDATEWERTLTIRSVGQVAGADGPERWIEIKTSMQKSSDVNAPPGPVATRIYKVLVPEKQEGLGALPQADDDVPFAFLRITKGYRKMGDGAVEPIESGVLQVAPTLTLLRHYRSFEEGSGADSDPELQDFAGLAAKKYTGTTTLESRQFRSTNTGNLWLSDDVPFGLARWDVSVIREVKEATASRETFAKEVEISVQMRLKEKSAGARAEITED